MPVPIRTLIVLSSSRKIYVASGSYAIALPISSLDTSHNLGRDFGLGDSPPDGTPSKKSDIPGELLPLSVRIWLLTTSSS